MARTFKEQSALQSQKAEEARELKKFASQQKLTEIQTQSVLDALGAQITESRKEESKLSQQRAERASKAGQLASQYLRSQTAGTDAARIRAFVDLSRAAKRDRIDFAKAAYTYDEALFRGIMAKIPEYEKGAEGGKKPDVARQAWSAYFNAVGAEGADVLGNLEEMYRRFGSPTGLFKGEAFYERSQRIQDVRDRAESNVKAFEAATKDFSDSWEQFLLENPGLDPESEATIRQYMNEKKIRVDQLPASDPTFNNFLQGVAKDPEGNPAFFGDIDTRVKELKAEREGLLGEMRKPIGVEGEEPVPVERELTEREKLVGWLQQEDTRDWAQSHGFRLGTVREPTQKELADIEAGKLPRDYLVKGMVYNPSPDDMQAVRFAERQMKMKPQEDVLYRLGLRGDRTRRGTAEITVQTKPAIPGKPVRALKMATFGEKDFAVGDDGKFYSSSDGGKTWSGATTEEGKKALLRGDQAPLGEDKPELPGVSTPETPAETKTYTIEEQGWIYGRDLGTATGIDRTPGSPTFGQRVSFPKERVVSRERIGLERVRPTLAEKMDLRLAQRREAERQAEERELIGPKASRAAVRERAETAKRMRELPAAVSTEPGELLEEKGITGPIESPAIRMLPEEAKDEQIAEAERLSVPVTRIPEIFEQRPQPIPLQKLTTPEARANIGFIRDASKALAKREAEGAPVAATQPEQMPGSGLSSQEAAFAASMRRRKAPPVPLP